MAMTLVINGHIIMDVEAFIRHALTACSIDTDDQVRVNTLLEMQKLVKIPDKPATITESMADSH